MKETQGLQPGERFICAVCHEELPKHSASCPYGVQPCPAQAAKREGSASSTTSTSQESGQNESWADRLHEIQKQVSLREISGLMADMLHEQRQTNELLAALIEAMGQDPDPEELHIPRPL